MYDSFIHYFSSPHTRHTNALRGALTTGWKQTILLLCCIRLSARNAGLETHCCSTASCQGSATQFRVNTLRHSVTGYVKKSPPLHQYTFSSQSLRPMWTPVSHPKHITSSSGMMVTQTSWTMSVQPASRRTAASTTQTCLPAKRKGSREHWGNLF